MGLFLCRFNFQSKNENFFSPVIILDLTKNFIFLFPPSQKVYCINKILTKNLQIHL